MIYIPVIVCAVLIILVLAIQLMASNAPVECNFKNLKEIEEIIKSYEKVVKRCKIFSMAFITLAIIFLILALIC